MFFDIDNKSVKTINLFVFCIFVLLPKCAMKISNIQRKRCLTTSLVLIKLFLRTMLFPSMNLFASWATFNHSEKSEQLFVSCSEDFRILSECSLKAACVTYVSFRIVTNFSYILDGYRRFPRRLWGSLDNFLLIYHNYAKYSTRLHIHQ